MRQIEQQLRRHFHDIRPDLSLSIKNMAAKKAVYKAGDPIFNIYFIISGSFALSFHEKTVQVLPGMVIGDYEPANHLTRRISTLRAHSRATIVTLPFDFYFNVKEETFNNDKFLMGCIPCCDKRAKYLMSKLFQEVRVSRGQQVTLQSAQDPAISSNSCKEESMALICEGNFTIKESIDVKVLRKYSMKVERMYQIAEIGRGSFTKDNLICKSLKGSLFICQQKHLKGLLSNFQEVDEFFKVALQSKQTHFYRKAEIQAICWSSQKLGKSSLPLGLQQNQSEMFMQNKNNKAVPAQQLHGNKSLLFQGQDQEKNHFQIKMDQKDRLFSEPTNSNLQIIPFFKSRRPSVPSEVKLPFKRGAERLKKVLIGHRSQDEDNLVPKRGKEWRKNIEIPYIFDCKFKRKMFLKMNNPFSHHRSQSMEKEQQKLPSKIQSLEKKMSKLVIFTEQYH